MSYEEKTIINNPFLQFLVGRQWRWARHIIFLLLVFWLVYKTEPPYLAPWDTYMKLVGCFVLLFPFYTNLYWLIPRFLFRNKYGNYAAAVLMLAGLTGLLSLAKHEWLDPYRIEAGQRLGAREVGGARISGTSAVAMTKQIAMRKNASAKVCTSASR